MPQIVTKGIQLEYETFGSPKNPTILLVMGLGCQLIHWPVELCERLVGLGYHVIRFDNRDVGLSTILDHKGRPNLKRIILFRTLRLPHPVPYTLKDMAKDTLGLLDALGVERVHLVGISMGGMIAQIIAAHYPGRVLSLTSIMSASGNPWISPSKPEAAKALLTPPADPNNFDAIVERSVRINKVIQSPKFARDDEELRRRAEIVVSRSHHPEGTLRQMVAAFTSGDRRNQLKKITVPAMVFHGDQDPLIKVECGIDTAHHLPNSELRVIPGMGHDLPDAILPELADAIVSAAKRAE